MLTDVCSRNWSVNTNAMTPLLIVCYPLPVVKSELMRVSIPNNIIMASLLAIVDIHHADNKDLEKDSSKEQEESCPGASKIMARPNILDDCTGIIAHLKLQIYACGMQFRYPNTYYFSGYSW